VRYNPRAGQKSRFSWYFSKENIVADSKDPSEKLINEIKRHLTLTLGRDRFSTTRWNMYEALALTIRDHLIDRWINTQQQYYLQDAKRVYYLSMEFLIGRALGNAILNLDLGKEVKDALVELGYRFEDIEDEEPDAGLGNGGLGRLAACFLDSMATLNLPAYGYGLRYEHGIFHQLIKDGYQIEEPDNWLRGGNPWEICHAEQAMPVGFGGHVEEYIDPVTKRLVVKWFPAEEVIAVPYDTPVPGYQTRTVNTLRLWAARASNNEFDLNLFNEGAYVEAIEQRALAENLTKILYPNDQVAQGRELRLRQQYFMASATLQDILRRYDKYHADFSNFVDKTAIQLNDTHPAIAIPELMRLFIDVYRLDWDYAWSLASGTFAYTNHTLLEEALEKWSVELMSKLLPRHMSIITEINRRFLRQVANKFPGDTQRLSRMSLVTDGHGPQVRMAYLAIVSSHSVNGVAKLHTDLLKSQLVRDFHEMYPDRFNSKTNGISQRRWILQCNPELTELVTEKIGTDWIGTLTELKKLRAFAEDLEFHKRWKEIKQGKKDALAKIIKDELGIEVDPTSIFDVQIKRFHEYKRQLMNILNVIALYIRLKNGPCPDFVPRTVIFSGKAAPGYAMAKLIIKLIGSVAEVVNKDPEIGHRLKVVFLPDYRVSLAEKIIPASDLSEQISTAGKEASGTGNMKLALNGSLTIGTLDGANIEMLEEIGEDNMFIFGLKVEEVIALKKQGYNPRDYAKPGTTLFKVLQLIDSGHFCFESPELFNPLLHSLLDAGDPYMVLADFESYAQCQDRVAKVYRDQTEWTRQSIMNVAGIGFFSSDRTIQQYANEIWNVKPCLIEDDRVDWGDDVPTLAKPISKS
jgi:glycogen phosphorylase